MGSPNGGIIGVVNPTSFGKNTITTGTSGSTSVTTQPGTRLIDYLVVAGGGAGGGATLSSVGGAGGGAGGYRASGFGPACLQGSTLNVCGATSYPIVVGAGGTGVSACRGGNGSPSSFASPSSFGITSTGGGGGGARCGT